MREERAKAPAPRRGAARPAARKSAGPSAGGAASKRNPPRGSARRRRRRGAAARAGDRGGRGGPARDRGRARRSGGVGHARGDGALHQPPRGGQAGGRRAVRALGGGRGLGEPGRSCAASVARRGAVSEHPYTHRTSCTDRQGGRGDPGCLHRRRQRTDDGARSAAQRAALGPRGPRLRRRSRAAGGPAAARPDRQPRTDGARLRRTGGRPRCPDWRCWCAAGRLRWPTASAACAAGADDWVTKPCHPEELVARIEAVLRRRRAGDVPADEETIAAGELAIRPDRFDAYAGESAASLSRKEYELLHQLATAGGRVLEREDIYQRVWGYTMARGDRSVDVFVRKLRQKLERISPEWRYVHTHFGVGYRFAAETADGRPAPIAGPVAGRAGWPAHGAAAAESAARRGSRTRASGRRPSPPRRRRNLQAVSIARQPAQRRDHRRDRGRGRLRPRRRHDRQGRDHGRLADLPGGAGLGGVDHVPGAPHHAVLARRLPAGRAVRGGGGAGGDAHRHRRSCGTRAPGSVAWLVLVGGSVYTLFAVVWAARRY